MKNLRSIFWLLTLALYAGGYTRAQAFLFEKAGPQEIRITSSPGEALLSINGQEVGHTPYVIKEPTFGKYFIRATKDGYEPLEKIVDIDAQSSPEINLTLERTTGLLLFDSTPTGAEVTINGAYRGKTPFIIADLPTGTYKASYTLEGYDPREMEVIVTDRIPKLCHMSMKSLYAVVHIDSEPAGAAVIIDGIHKGKTPCTLEDVLLGEHTMKLIRDGFEEKTTQINLTKSEEETKIRVELKEILATLDVITSPPEARVTVDRDYKGKSPLEVTGLRDGNYQVVIEKPGYETITQKIDIRNKKDAKIDVNLVKSTGGLVLNVSPTGSTVVVLGTEVKTLSNDSPLSIELPPGKYNVEVSKPAFHPQRFEVVVALRETITKSITLKRVFKKDTQLILKDGRTKEGMLSSQAPNGSIRLETAEGVFEEFTSADYTAVNKLP